MSMHIEWVDPHELVTSLWNRGENLGGYPVEKDHAVFIGDLDNGMAIEGAKPDVITAIDTLMSNLLYVRRQILGEAEQ